MFKCRLYDNCLCPIQAGQIQKKDFHYPKYWAVEVSDLRVKTSPYFKSCRLNLRCSFECVCARTRELSRSVMSDSLWPHGLQAPLSIEFSRQEYWSGLPFPTPGDLPNPGIEPVSPAFPALAGRFLTPCMVCCKRILWASRISVTQSNVLTTPMCTARQWDARIEHLAPTPSC